MIDDSDCPVDVSVVRCDDRSVAVAATVFRRKNLDLESDFRKFGTVPMLRSLIRILRFFLQIDTEMAEKYAEQRHPAVCGKVGIGRYAAGCVSVLMGLVTLTFDILTLKLVCESASKVGNLHRIWAR